jgi:hypothetical protein
MASTQELDQEAALKAGEQSLIAPSDQFYGDRNAGAKDV